jgi:hypothetical protein
MAIPENQLETWLLQGAIMPALKYKHIHIAPRTKFPFSMNEWGSEVFVFSLQDAFVSSIIRHNNTPHASPRCAPWGVAFLGGSLI